MHGGTINDIFKTIKYGYPEKGMRAWKDEFSPVKMAEMASFIKSIRGTNPPNGKEKQGDLFTDVPTGKDSTAAPAIDSTITIKKDSSMASISAK